MANRKEYRLAALEVALHMDRIEADLLMSPNCTTRSYKAYTPETLKLAVDAWEKVITPSPQWQDMLLTSLAAVFLAAVLLWAGGYWTLSISLLS